MLVRKSSLGVLTIFAASTSLPPSKLQHHLLLDRTAILRNAHGEPACLRLCKTCNTALEKDRVPMFALANHMWVGAVPKVLQRLTVAEQVLIGVGRTKCCIYREEL